MMSMASSAPKHRTVHYGLRYLRRGYMFRNVMKTLREKYPIATGAVAYTTDDVISKTMGIVLPNIMKAAGTEITSVIRN